MSTCVSAAIANLIPSEVGDPIQALCRSFTTGWHRSSVATMNIEAIIYVSVEVGRAMKPRASADKETIHKPLRAVVAVWSTLVWRNVVVAIRTNRRSSDLDAHLSLCFGSGYDEADANNKG